MDDLMTRDFELPSQLCSPQSVLWQMARVAHHQHTPSFVLLQEAADQLAEKARQGKAFTDAEMLFLKVLFENPWWGGREHGFNEAKQFVNPDPDATGRHISDNKAVRNISDPAQLALAKLAYHYVNGSGQCLAIDLMVYKNSLIVQDTVAALKNYIRELFAFNKPATFLSTEDVGFLNSAHAGKIESKRRQAEDMGFIFTDGTLLLEQKDPRIRNIANRFKISAMTNLNGAVLTTRWRIEGRYQFESFGGQQDVTGLPLTDNKVLHIANGLGNHIADLGLAKPFQYFGDWVERY